MISLTPSGGFHAIFFARPGGRTKKALGIVDGVDYLAGGHYFVAPYSWRPEHTANGRLKAAGTYVAIWDEWKPVPIPDEIYGMLFSRDGEKGRTDSSFHPTVPVESRPQWMQLQDSLMRTRQGDPNITAEQAADMWWKHHVQDGWLPDENPDWPWTRGEFVTRARNAWENRDGWEKKNPPKEKTARRRRPRRGESGATRPPDPRTRRS